MDSGLLSQASISTFRTQEVEVEEDARVLQKTDKARSTFKEDIRKSTKLSQKRRDSKVKLEDFEILMHLGSGSFGKVLLAKLPQFDELFAIKVIRKDLLVQSNQIESSALERDILFKINHQFLVSMQYAFMTESRIYFVMEYVDGGELHHIFNK